jgi:AhpC/TSA family
MSCSSSIAVIGDFGASTSSASWPVTHRGSRSAACSSSGVSQDGVEDSQAFAERYGIAFPLLSDLDRSVSRAYTGIDGADNTIPGIVVIRRNGQIAYRQIAREKDDRLDSAQLLAILDRTLGTSGRDAIGGYTALERMQLGIEGGVAVGDEVASSVHVRVALPLGRFAFAGVLAGTEAPRAAFDGSVMLGLRAPFLGNTSAIHLFALGGLANTTPYAGGRLGLWFAFRPTWALHLDAGVTTLPDLTITFGVSRLISWR